MAKELNCRKNRCFIETRDRLMPTFIFRVPSRRLYSRFNDRATRRIALAWYLCRI